MPSPHELVAHNRTTEQIAEEIGAHRVIFQTLPDLIKSCQQFNPSIETFDCSVFTGEYVTGGVDAAYLDSLVVLRNDNAKIKAEGAGGGVVVKEVEEAPLGCSGPMSKLSLPYYRRAMSVGRQVGGGDRRSRRGRLKERVLIDLSLPLPLPRRIGLHHRPVEPLRRTLCSQCGPGPSQFLESANLLILRSLARSGT